MVSSNIYNLLYTKLYTNASSTFAHILISIYKVSHIITSIMQIHYSAGVIIHEYTRSLHAKYILYISRSR